SGHCLEVHDQGRAGQVRGDRPELQPVAEREVPGGRQAPLAGEGGRLRTVRSSSREGVTGLALVLPPFFLLVFFILVPAAEAVLDTLRVERGGQIVYSLVRYAEMLRTVSLRRSVVFTILVTLASVGVTFALAYALALYLRFSKGWVSTLLGALFIIPLFIPTVIASFAMVTFLEHHGYVATLLHTIGVEDTPSLVFNATGIVLTEVWASIPFATLVLLAGLQGIDDALIDSARDVGAGALRTFLAGGLFWFWSVGAFRRSLPVLFLAGLAAFILGPLLSLILWAFAGRWFYPALLPQEFSLKWWDVVFGNRSVVSSIKYSLMTAPTVTLLSALICLPA